MSETPRPYNIAATGNLGPIGGTNSGARLWNIVVNKGAASATLTLYDGQSASGVAKGVIDCANARSIPYAGSWFKNGIFAVLAGGNADVTIEAA